MSDVRRKPAGLSESMTESQFENGYWYATELKDFATRLGVPSVAGSAKTSSRKRSGISSATAK